MGAKALGMGAGHGVNKALVKQNQGRQDGPGFIIRHRREPTTMGTFTVSIQASNLAGQQFLELEALVDTGATYTALPANVLSQMGVEQEDIRRFELADNQIVEYPVGQIRVRLDGRELITLAVFAPVDTTPLLGATTLETFGLGVDPVGQKLIPVTALLK